MVAQLERDFAACFWDGDCAVVVVQFDGQLVCFKAALVGQADTDDAAHCLRAEAAAVYGQLGLRGQVAGVFSADFVKDFGGGFLGGGADVVKIDLHDLNPCQVSDDGDGDVEGCAFEAQRAVGNFFQAHGERDGARAAVLV